MRPPRAWSREGGLARARSGVGPAGILWRITDESFASSATRSSPCIEQRGAAVRSRTIYPKIFFLAEAGLPDPPDDRTTKVRTGAIWCGSSGRRQGGRPRVRNGLADAKDELLERNTRHHSGHVARPARVRKGAVRIL
jgi:hypothetical protein